MEYFSEDAVYARIVYGTEYADRLWGLPEVVVSRPLLDPAAVCLIRVRFDPFINLTTIDHFYAFMKKRNCNAHYHIIVFLCMLHAEICQSAR